MAFPQVSGSTTSTDTGSDTNHVVSLPASIAAGELLMVFHFGGATDSTPNTAATGWTLLKDRPANFAVGHLACLYKVADGGEGATVTLTTDLAELSSAIAIRISGWHGTSVPEVSTGLAGTGTAPNPDSLTPSWGVEDTLWIAAVGVTGGVVNVTGFPSNMPDNNLTAANSGQGDVGIATVESAAASFDPNAFANTNAHFGTFTIAVRPAAAAGGDRPSLISGKLVHNGLLLRGLIN
jgi:hypothetical protein